MRVELALANLTAIERSSITLRALCSRMYTRFSEAFRTLEPRFLRDDVYSELVRRAQDPTSDVTAMSMYLTDVNIPASIFLEAYRALLTEIGARGAGKMFSNVEHNSPSVPARLPPALAKRKRAKLNLTCARFIKLTRARSTISDGRQSFSWQGVCTAPRLACFDTWMQLVGLFGCYRAGRFVRSRLGSPRWAIIS